MLMDGRKIATDISEEIRAELLNIPLLTLLVLQVGNDLATESFIRMKKAFADKVGIKVEVEKFPGGVMTHELVGRVKKANQDLHISGTIVQLPLPKSVNTREVLDAINPAKDPDLLSVESKAEFAGGASPVMPPVVAAIEQILARHYVDVTTLDTVVLGYGPLVGEPVTVWLKNLGVDYGLVTAETEHKDKVIRSAELLITGAGDPGFVKPEMLRDGVVIIDAGTSETPNPEAPLAPSGRLVGDCDPACADKASLMTPVPGGVGPVAVAMLFKNLVELSRLASK